MLICFILIKSKHNLLLLLLAGHAKSSSRVTHIHLTLSPGIKAKKSGFESEEVIFESEVSQARPKT